MPTMFANELLDSSDVTPCVGHEVTLNSSDTPIFSFSRQAKSHEQVTTTTTTHLSSESQFSSAVNDEECGIGDISAKESDRTINGTCGSRQQYHSTLRRLSREHIPSFRYLSGPSGSTSHMTSMVVELNHSRSRIHSHANPMGTCFEDASRPSRFDQIINSAPPSLEVMEAHAWNPDDRSLNIFVKDDDRLTFHRHPVAQSTDSIRTKIGFTRGFHVWQIKWPQRQRGTHASVGVATKAASLHSVGYTSLVGSTSESYGWDLIRNKCHHNSRNSSCWTYPACAVRDENVIAPDEFYCILDMDDGYLAFASDAEYYGVAFTGLKGRKLYPVVSAVWGHCEITIKYLGGLDPEPLSLMESCRRSIRTYLGRENIHRVRELRLPNGLKKYLMNKL
ncbi:unnamed protein product [Thelazia callipaeda]|uniref:B30.2/SPRY domain-containing protein n=1 Tax=Thelazia callipaeda TaxID=103827 RepID=A0A0N5D2Q1_THECL|nr:unnamed protein product [Thelazia callipaeda]